MIPKLLHQIWVGGQPIPKNLLFFQKSWVTYHPHWHIKLWSEENIETLIFFDIAVFNKCCNFVEKADYLRIIILLEHG